MNKRVLVIIISIFVTLSVYTQTDREFWFAAPDVSSVHGNAPQNGAPIYFHITAVYPTTVTIDRPADSSFTPIVFNLTQLEHRTISLVDTFNNNINEIENYPNNIVQNKGFRIRSDPGEITVYYELDNYYNRDIFPLKGENALGTDFYVSTQNKWNNGTYGGTAFSGFVICATENNTQVTIHRNDTWYNYPGAPPEVINIVLDAGETYAFRAADRFAVNHINGVHIESDKNIVITVYDDSMEKQSCRDIFGDQIVPTNIVGQEYLVMKGFLNWSATDGGERIYVTATESNTDITVNGTYRTTLANPGDLWFEEIDTIPGNTVHVYASKPIYVNHLTGFGCELGGAVLPSIDGCTGSNDVTFTRTPNASDQFFLNIMVRNDTNPASPLYNQSVQNFTITSGGTTTAIPPNYFQFINSDSTFATLLHTPTVNNFIASLIGVGQEALVQNNFSKFHLGVINGGGTTGCKYGYFSDYSDSRATAGLGGATAVTQDSYCDLDPIQLVASGGIAYDWDGVSDPHLTQQLSDSTVAAPYFTPDTSGVYVFQVHVVQECYADTTLTLVARVFIGPTSDFVSDDIICSPNPVHFTNLTDTNYAKSMEWDFGYPGAVVNQDTLPNPFEWDFPPNTSEVAKNYKVRLVSKADFGSCPHIREKTIKILPEITADFDLSDTTGCSPLIPVFTNLSSGHLDSTSYYWDFGDESQSFDSMPVKSFTNFSFNDTTYTVKLVAESPFGCKDSITRDVNIYPRVKASFAIDKAISCSPLVNVIQNNSIGVQTFNWHFWDTKSQFDSTVTNGSYADIPFYHNDATQPDPDTIYVEMNGVNAWGCTDTATSRRLIVYPEVHSIFDLSDTVMCDSTLILFTNNSIGYNLEYDWDFGNGNSSSADSVTQRFFNRSDADTVYYISLAVESDYYCTDTLVKSVLVHPLIRANFAIEYSTNCTPLDARIDNSSVRVHDYFWDLGDGTTDTTSAPFFYHQFWNPLVDRDTVLIIKLIATNNEGCSDSLQRSLLLLPQVVAAFNLEDSVGCSPLNVTFHNNSTGKDLSYDWDFGNNIFSTDTISTFSKIYNNITDTDTTFIVSLTATNPFGCDSVLTSEVTAFAEIDANFTLPVSDSCSPFTIRPNNYSSVGAQTFEWDFGPLGTSTDFEPVLGSAYTNTSTVEDTVNIQLIAYGINDAAHLACADTHYAQIVIFPELDVDFALDNYMDCRPLQVNFTNNTNIQGGSLFRWRLDNNVFSTAITPSTLEIENLTPVDVDHIIKLTGESNHGCRDTMQTTVTVYSFIEASFNIDKPAICSGDSFAIDRTSSEGDIASYLWDFNSEATETWADPTFGYSFDNMIGSATLNKIITLTVTNPHGCDSSWIDSIYVYPNVTADFDRDFVAVCYPHFSEFTNQSINASEYYWDFGDGSNTGAENPVHLLQNFGNVVDSVYTIKLISKSEFDCWDSISKPVTIYAKPESEFSFPVTADCPPFTIPFQDQSIGMNLVYNWDFGGEGSSNIQNPSYTFSNPTTAVQTKKIVLVVESDRGCIDSAFKSINVYPNVIVDFTVSDISGCSPLDVTFTGDTSNVSSITWYIDDVAWSNSIVTTERLDNLTSENKTFNIRLYGSSEYECESDTTKQVTVYPTPTSEFLNTPTRQNYNTEEDQTTIEFTNSTNYQGVWNYTWDYGDGNSDSQSSPRFTYTYGDRVWGDINDDNRLYVNLLAWNQNNPECRDSITKVIYINPPIPEVEIDEIIEACAPYAVDFSSVTDYIYEDSYYWDFGVPGATSEEISPSYTYNEPGWYTVTLEIEGDGGINYDYKIVKVNPKPIVDFAFNDSLVFVRSQNQDDEIINFYNQTMFGIEHEWDFGDGSYSYEKDPTHFYSDTGIYYVTLISTTDKGCMDTLTSPQPIVVLGEASLQFPTGFIVDPNGAVDGHVDNPESTDLRIFRPYAQGVAEYKLEVYNRWGVLIFESKDVSDGWNGYIDGKIAKQDVYVWRAIGKFTNGQPFEMSGDVTLIVAPRSGQVND